MAPGRAREREPGPRSLTPCPGCCRLPWGAGGGYGQAAGSDIFYRLVRMFSHRIFSTEKEPADVDRVLFPGTFGSRRPWHFPFAASYWKDVCGLVVGRRHALGPDLLVLSRVSGVEGW